MAEDIDKIWQQFSTENFSDSKSVPLRQGSNFKKAEPWLLGVSGPSMPTQMLSNVEVFDSWLNAQNMDIAKKLIQHNNEMTIRDLVGGMLNQVASDKTTIPYIWWIWPHSSKKRAIHQDANGITFVKLNSKWQMALPIQAIGALVGASSSELDYEQLPRNAYFVSWENKEAALEHAS